MCGILFHRVTSRFKSRVSDYHTAQTKLISRKFPAAEKHGAVLLFFIPNARRGIPKHGLPRVRGPCNGQVSRGNLWANQPPPGRAFSLKSTVLIVVSWTIPCGRSQGFVNHEICLRDTIPTSYDTRTRTHAHGREALTQTLQGHYLHGFRRQIVDSIISCRSAFLIFLVSTFLFAFGASSFWTGPLWLRPDLNHVEDCGSNDISGRDIVHRCGGSIHHCFCFCLIYRWCGILDRFCWCFIHRWQPGNVHL